jgi:hypothetical protein
MNSLASLRTCMHPVSEEEHRLVRNELTELLKNPHFSNSKRYPALLEYVVETTLAGRSDELKERTLGIEVFHRPPDYDTSSDTVVRVAAGEVRKRLALVYHESEVEHAVQITLPAGSYVPEFFLTTSQEALVSPVHTEPALEQRLKRREIEELTPMSAPTTRRTRWWKPGAALALIMLATGFIGLFVHLWTEPRQSSVELFWQPIHASPNPAIICLGAMVRSANTPSGMAMAAREDDHPFTSMATAVVLAELSNLFSKSHTNYIVQPTSSTTLTDMRERPVILIGAYDNEWTGRLQNDLRYRFAPGPARQIYDAINPSITWTRPASLPLKQEDDYAIVGRFHSKLTDNLIVLIAGIGKNGTEAAARFVTAPRYMDLLNQQSKDWASKNVEVVLKVKVIDGENGAPSIEAVYVW